MRTSVFREKNMFYKFCNFYPKTLNVFTFIFRLSGLSPFMGDTDIETMANVTIAKYDFDHDAFANISEDAKDFIRCLLVKDKEYVSLVIFEKYYAV